MSHFSCLEGLATGLADVSQSRALFLRRGVDEHPPLGYKRPPSDG